MNKRFDTVIFDVDSTLTTIEGLDFLAKIKGNEKEVVDLTRKAMNGEIPMELAMKTKMEIISPSMDDFLRMGQEYVKNITLGAIDTIKILKNNEIEVFVVTGNFQPGVNILTKKLKIPDSNVIANIVFFDSKNNYSGYDEQNLLSKNNGKAEIVKTLKLELGRTVFVGDGSTDLETKPYVDLFIGFGGVAYRPKIEEKSDIYIKERDLRPILSYIL